MKPEIRFIQHAIGLNFLKQSTLLQFFRSHHFQQIPENIGQILIQERMIGLDQFRKIQEKVRQEQAEESAPPEELTVSMSIPLAGGNMEVPLLVQESSSHIDKLKSATRRLTPVDMEAMQKQTLSRGMEPPISVPHHSKQTPSTSRDTSSTMPSEAMQTVPSSPSGQPFLTPTEKHSRKKINEFVLEEEAPPERTFGEVEQPHPQFEPPQNIEDFDRPDEPIRQGTFFSHIPDTPTNAEEVSNTSSTPSKKDLGETINTPISQSLSGAKKSTPTEEQVPQSLFDSNTELAGSSLSEIGEAISDKIASVADTITSIEPTEEALLQPTKEARQEIPTQQKQASEILAVNIPLATRQSPFLPQENQQVDEELSSQELLFQAKKKRKKETQPVENTQGSTDLEIVLDDSSDIPDINNIGRLLTKGRRESFQPGITKSGSEKQQQDTQSLSNIQASPSTESSPTSLSDAPLPPSATHQQKSSFTIIDRAVDQGNTQQIPESITPQASHSDLLASRVLPPPSVSKLVNPLDESSSSGETSGYTTSLAEVRLGKIAVQKKLISVAQLKACLDEQQQLSRQGNTVSLDNLLIRKSLLSPEELESLKKENETVEVGQTFPEFGGQEVILGKYRILQKLGSGGMGAVYKVEHVLLQHNRFFALKIMHACFADNETNYKRFVREVEVAMGLVHRNIVAIREFGLLPNQSPYLIMDFCPGKTLESILKDQWNCNLLRSIEIIQQVLDGVVEAHKCNVIHRDLKPANILIEQNEGKDIVKIVDFGLAKLAEESEHLESLTQGILGTPLYMSPEQAGGERVDKRSDLYSIGMILYEMAAGRLPFKTKSLREMLVKQMFEAPTPPRYHNEHIPEDLEAIILKSLAKKTEERYQTAQEFWQDLEDCSIQAAVKGKAAASRKAKGQPGVIPMPEAVHQPDTEKGHEEHEPQAKQKILGTAAAPAGHRTAVHQPPTAVFDESDAGKVAGLTGNVRRMTETLPIGGTPPLGVNQPRPDDKTESFQKIPPPSQPHHFVRNIFLFLLLLGISGIVSYYVSPEARQFVDTIWDKITPRQSSINTPNHPPDVPRPVTPTVRTFSVALDDVKNYAKRKLWDDAYTSLVEAKQLSQTPQEIQEVQTWETYLMDRKQEERAYQKARESSNLAYNRQDYPEAIRLLQTFSTSYPKSLYDTDVRKRIEELAVLEQEFIKQREQELQIQIAKAKQQLQTALEQKRWNEATQIIEQLKTICPENSPERQQIAIWDFYIQKEIAEEKEFQKTKDLVLREREKEAYPEAIRLWENFLSRFEKTSRRSEIQENIDFLKNLQEKKAGAKYIQFITEAKSLISSKNYTKAMQVLTEAKKHRGQDTQVFALLGTLYYQKKDWKNAQTCFESAMNSLNGDMLYMLADAQAKQNNYSKAILTMNQAIGQLQEEQAAPSRMAECYSMLGTFYQKTRDDNKAISAYQKANEALEKSGGPTTKYQEMYQNLASLCARKKQTEEALKAIRIYQTLGGKDPKILGLVLELSDFTPICVGKKWAYSRRFGSRKVQSNIEIIDQNQDKYLVKVDQDVTEDWSRQGDFFTRYFRKTGIAEKALKYPVRLNSTWVNEVQGQESQYKIVEVGLTVTVSAGKFTNCIKVAIQTSPIMWSYVYYAPSIGKIKQENMKQEGSNQAQILFEEELTSYE